MKVLFQNCEGEIIKIVGLKLSGLKCLFDNESGKEQFFNAYFRVNDRWLSVNVDDICCNVYEFDYDVSKEDEDEDDSFSLRNYDDWVKDMTITQANVSYTTEVVKLAIHLSDETMIVMESDQDCNTLFERVINV